MAITDNLSDALTKIRNASRAKHTTVDLKATKLSERVMEVLRKEGFIRAFKPMGEAPRKKLRVYLKYSKKTPAISHLVRVSKPGRREYKRAESLPRVLRGLGVAVISTSRGLLADREAYKQRIGGEVLFYVW